MLKILAKTIKVEKIIKSITMEFDENEVTFYDLTKALCQKLDESTPILLTKHVLDFKRFNFCTFKTEDFVENVNFDKMIFRHIIDKE